MRARGVWLPALALVWALPAHAAPPALTWRGEEHWRLVLADESGQLRLHRIAMPDGDELLTGSLRLDDAELGVTGTGRRRGGHLIIDLTIVGGVQDMPLDAGKRRLFAPGTAPVRLSSSGFAMLHADLDAISLNGRTVRYQTNVVTGDHLQGPVLRMGRLEHEVRR